MNHRIHFPHVAPGGHPFRAEVAAPSYALAVREVLEHCARGGVALEYVRLDGLQDLKGANLDGLKLSHCVVQNTNLQGATMRRASVEHTTFDHVYADASTTLDDSLLEVVRFTESTLNGMSARRAQFSGLRFEGTSAIGLDVEDAKFSSVRNIRSDLSGWKARMAYLGQFEGAESVIASADLDENNKAALRAYLSNHSRTATESYLAGLQPVTQRVPQ